MLRVVSDEIVTGSIQMPVVKPDLNKANPKLGVGTVNFSANCRYMYSKNGDYASLRAFNDFIRLVMIEMFVMFQGCSSLILIGPPDFPPPTGPDPGFVVWGARPSAGGATNEAPAAPRGIGVVSGYPPPHWGRGLGRWLCPLRRKIYWLLSGKWRILVHSGWYFCSNLKLYWQLYISGYILSA